MSKAKSGGGIGSRVNVSPPVRTGAPKSTLINPRAAASIGQQQIVTQTSAGKLALGTAKQEPLGNERALNMKPVVHLTGSQSRHGGGED